MSDIFAIAASLTIQGNAMQFLEEFGAKLLGAHGNLKRLEGQLENTKQLAVGLGMVFAGYEGLKGLLHLAEHGKELNHQQSMLLRNGIAYKDVINETTRAYQQFSREVPTASGPDFLRTANELVSVKGSLKGADEALVTSLKIEGLVSNSTGKSAEGQGYDLWRAVEDSGKIMNKAKTDELLGSMTQAIIATGGKISGSDFFTYARRANTAWKHDDVASMPLQVLEMQTLGASGAGVGRSAFANRVEGSLKLTKAQEAGWDQIGMLERHGKTSLVKDRDLEMQRPDQFIMEVIDKLNKAGIDNPDKVKAWEARALHGKDAVFFDTAYNAFTEKGEDGRTRYDKEKGNLERAQPLDKAYDTMMNTDMGANLEALSKQWNSFMEAVGGPLAKAAIPILQELTTTINKMAAFADKHQALTEMAGDIAAVGSGLLILVGTIKAAKAALAIQAALTGGGGSGVAAAEGIAAGVASAGHGPGRATSGGFSDSTIGKLSALASAAGLIYEGYEYSRAPPEQRKQLDDQYSKRADANAAAISDLGRAVRDALPWSNALHFTDDVPPPPAVATAERLNRAQQSEIRLPDHPRTPTPEQHHQFMPAVDRTVHEIQAALQRPYTPTPSSAQQPPHPFAAPALPNIDKQTDGMAKQLGDRLGKSLMGIVPTAGQSIDALTKAMDSKIALLPKAAMPAVNASMAGVGNDIAVGVSKLPGIAAGPISAAFSAIGAEVARAAASIGRGFSAPAVGGGRQAAPTPGAAGGRYHGASLEPPLAAPQRRVAQAVRPVVTAMNMPPIVIEHHSHTHLDGHEIKREVIRRVVADNELHRSVGGGDWHGTYAPVGTDMSDSV